MARIELVGIVVAPAHPRLGKAVFNDQRHYGQSPSFDGALATTGPPEREEANMKITAIRSPIPVWVGTRNQLIVKVETDEGIFGWGESGLSGREKAVVGALEHYREFLIGRDPIADRRDLAGDVPQPVFRGRARAAGGDLGDRHRAPRHQGQGARRAGLSAARRQAARPHPDLRHDLGAARAGNDRAGQGSDRGRLDRHAAVARGPRQTQARSTSRASISRRPPNGASKAREELGDDVVLGIDYHHRLSVAEAASFCQKMPSGTLDFLEEPIRDETPEAYESLRDDGRCALRHRRGIRQQVAVPALHRARHPPVQPHRRLQRRRPYRIDESRRAGARRTMST